MYVLNVQYNTHMHKQRAAGLGEWQGEVVWE